MRNLPRAGFVPRTVRSAGAKHSGHRVLHEVAGVRFGMVDGVLVAGDAPARALADLARAPLARPAGSRGSVAFASPAQRLIGWATATPDQTEIEIRAGWPE